MAYSTELADLLVGQLTKFATLHRHQLAGHVANLDFWLDEVAHCLAVIDGYDVRFEQMRGGQQRFLAEHGPGGLPHRGDFNNYRAEPKHVPDTALGRARRALRLAAHRFLRRCFDEGLIDRERSDLAHERLGIDPAELRRA